MTDEELARLVVNRRTEKYDVYIGRGSPFGNPFGVKKTDLVTFIVQNRETAILLYEAWLLEDDELVARVKRELRGKVLGCYCRPKACHGDVLARIANE